MSLKPVKGSVVLYTDGASRGNPGKAALGVHSPTLNFTFGKTIGTASNNVSEYRALLFGLEKIIEVLGKKKAKASFVECYLDSELVVKQLNHEYKIRDKNMQLLFIEVWNRMLDFSGVTFTHVARSQNTKADAAANKALDEKKS